MTRHALVPPQRLKPVAGAVVRLALDRAPVEPAVKSRAAGIAYVDPDGRALFLKRSGDGDAAGTWCFPGGGIEAGETAEDAAVRESREECGANPYGARSLLAHTPMQGGGHYTTFAQPVKHAFTPKLNGEHTEHQWAPLGQPPEPLHPGVRQALGGLAMDAEWKEGDHPRAENGQFGSGGATSQSTGHNDRVPAEPNAPGHPGGAQGAYQGSNVTVQRGIDPETLKYSEQDQSRLDAVRQDFPDGEYPPIVAVQESDGLLRIIDGHNRTSVAKERGHKIDAVAISGPAYERLKEAGYDDMEIAYAALTDAGEYDAASNINQQFPGADIAGRGDDAVNLLNESTASDSSDAPGELAPPGYHRVGQLGQDSSNAALSGAVSVSGLAQDEEHWITVNGGEGKGTPLLISGGGVVVGGAGGNLNGKVLDPKSKSAPRASETSKASKSADIAKALQNRNRSSAASVSQMNKIASNPNPRLLMASPTMADGAPVVTDLEGKGIAKLTGHRDWVVTGKREIPVRYAVVEASDLAASNRADGTKNDDYAKNPDKLTAINNGRTAGVQEAYARGTADAYKAALIKGERVTGIPGKAIKAMKAPVLVRIMDAADVDEHIGDESNSGMTLSLSAVEQAQNDAARFDPSAIEYSDDGAPTDASVKGFINAMPEAERQSLAPNGRPTKQAIDRMLAATFHAAYGDSELVGLMAQATDPESRNLISGMSKAAGPMAKLKDAGELDIRELVTGAAKQIINAVRSGVSIKKFLKQGDLLTNSAEDQIAALFAENARSAKAIGERLSAAANFAYEESQKGGTDMFGEAIPQASRTDVLENLHAQS